MEMHSLQSLRRTHGIDVRPTPASRRVSRLTYANCRAMAGKARAVVLMPVMKLAAKVVAAEIRYLLGLGDIGRGGGKGRGRPDYGLV